MRRRPAMSRSDSWSQYWTSSQRFFCRQDWSIFIGRDITVTGNEKLKQKFNPQFIILSFCGVKLWGRRGSFITWTFYPWWLLILSEDGVADEKCDGWPGLRLHSSGSQQTRMESTQHHLHLQTQSRWGFLNGARGKNFAFLGVIFSIAPCH